MRGAPMNTAYTVGCVPCGEFHAFVELDDAEDFLDRLRSIEPRDHDHDGLAIVEQSADKVFPWDTLREIAT